MQKLQCEICGGSLIMTEDGENAVCENCGMRFKKETIKKMILELSGSVKIDGPVQVEGMESADALYRRGQGFEQIEEYEKAKRVYKELTNKYPMDGRGWEGYAEMAVWTRDKLSDDVHYSDDEYYQDVSLNPRWTDYVEKLLDRAACLLEDEAQKSSARIKKEQFQTWYKRQREKKQLEEIWSKRNAKFLENFKFKYLLPELLGHPLEKIFYKPNEIATLSYTYVWGDTIKGTYKRKKWSDQDFTLELLPQFHTYTDIRPLLDGKQLPALFCKKYYSYADDPDIDK